MGELPKDCRTVDVEEGCLLLPFSAFSSTPNSFMDSSVAKLGSVTCMPSAPTFMLVRLDGKSDEWLFNGGDVTVEERLAMRGILVGVSFVRLEEANDVGSCTSLCSWD